MTVTGAKYVQGRDVAEIAKLLRADFKAAITAGTLPAGFKASVRIARASMCRSIDVRITACPGLVVFNPARLVRERAGLPVATDMPVFSEAARALLATVEGLLQAYQRNNSDSMTDYSDINFYDDTAFDSEFRTAALVAEQAALTVALLAPTAAPVAPVARPEEPELVL